MNGAQTGTFCHNSRMQLAFCILASACSTVAMVLSILALIKARVTPESILRDQVDGIDRELKAIKQVDLPRVEMAAEVHLEQARGMLESAETKRRRAAARASKGNGSDPQGEMMHPWDDPNLTSAQKRQLIEAHVNRGGS